MEDFFVSRLEDILRTACANVIGLVKERENFLKSKIDSLLLQNSQLQKEISTFLNAENDVLPSNKCNVAISQKEVEERDTEDTNINDKSNVSVKENVEESKSQKQRLCKITKAKNQQHDAFIPPCDEQKELEPTLTCLVNPFELLGFETDSENITPDDSSTSELIFNKDTDRYPLFMTPNKTSQRPDSCTPIRRKKLFTPSSQPQTFSPTELERNVSNNLVKVQLKTPKSLASLRNLDK